MKQKLTFLFALLCVSVMGWAIDWSGYEWIGNGSGNAAYTDKFKMTLATGQAYVNIQEPGFATAPGIYTTFPAGVTSCSLPASAYDVQGAGMILHVAYFTAQETEITVVHGEGTAVFTVYYADGTTGGGSLTDPELSLNETAVTLDATVPETFQINPSQNGDGAISYESSNTNIASVSSTGLVTAVGRGTATITVRTAETATYAADSETLTVTVNGPINWAALSWIGNGSGDAANTEKWKMAEHSYVNIQHPGFASEAGIYAEFTAPIVYCSLGEGNYAVQGAGICMYLSAFTAEVTEVLVIGNHVQSIFYVYKDGATGTASLNDIIPTNIYDTNFALETNGGWASATSGTAWLGNNGDDGDRWEGA
ncbi:MAG: Ig-like domain-containing protein, partial [Paludibacteraceae bacterium]|nr:Ig-like domain-containing protein [Paludibacteraceae bacterium]